MNSPPLDKENNLQNYVISFCCWDTLPETNDFARGNQWLEDVSLPFEKPSIFTVVMKLPIVVGWIKQG